MKSFLRFGLLALVVHQAAAQIRIVGRGDGRSTIDLSQLRSGGGSLEQTFFITLQNDLQHSGYFAIVRGTTAEFRLGGTVTPGLARIQAVSVKQNATRYNKDIAFTAQDVYQRAHQAADELLMALRGVRGFASARLALIGTQTGHKELYTCDSSGKQLVRLTTDRKISLAPSWGPNGEIYYTSYLKGWPDIYKVDTLRNRRDRVCSFAGLNLGAAISPDGREMSMVLSKDGKPEIYVMPVGSNRPTPVTNTRLAAKSSPAWSPDGQQIVYVSDEAGRPHLYVVSRRGGRPQRITSSGSENVSPDWGPGGIVYSSRVGGRYRIAVADPSGRTAARFIGPDDADYEDPSWAPDGRHIAASRTVAYRSSVILLDTQEPAQVRTLIQGNGDWYAPAWTP